MKKLRNFLLGLFAFLLVFMPVAFVGCGENQGDPQEPIQIQSDAYYYAGEEYDYTVLWFNRENDEVLIYQCSSVPSLEFEDIDSLIRYIKNAGVSTGGSTGHDYKIVNGVEVITSMAGTSTITPQGDSTIIEYVTTYRGEETRLIMTLYQGAEA